MKFRKFLFLFSGLLFMAMGCSPKVDTSSDPRQIVLNMFRAMDASDRSALARYLDFPSLLKSGGADYALQMDSVRSFTDPEQLLNDLCKGGLTNTRWSLMQRVVGEAKESGDSAIVDVSFLDRSSGTQYLTRFGLQKFGGVWRIFSFNYKDPQK